MTLTKRNVRLNAALIATTDQFSELSKIGS